MTIREIIQTSGLTQAAFATKYHIPLRSIENWVGGKRRSPEYIEYLLERCVLADYENKEKETD